MRILHSTAYKLVPRFYVTLDKSTADSGNEIGAPHLRLFQVIYGSSSAKLVISFCRDDFIRIRKFGTRRRKSCGKVR